MSSVHHQQEQCEQTKQQQQQQRRPVHIQFSRQQLDLIFATAAAKGRKVTCEATQEAQQKTQEDLAGPSEDTGDAESVGSNSEFLLCSSVS